MKNCENLDAIYNEISILYSLDHPNIVKLYEVYEYQDYIHLVTEYLDGGDLNQFFSENHNLTEANIAQIIREILLGVAYLHHNGICHKDLKPENIIFTKTSLQ